MCFPRRKGRGGRGRQASRTAARTAAVMRSRRGRTAARSVSSSTTRRPDGGSPGRRPPRRAGAGAHVRDAVGGAEGGDVDAVGRGDDPLERGPGHDRGVLQRLEDAPAVVVDEHDGQIGPRLPRHRQERVDVVQEGEVADEQPGGPEDRRDALGRGQRPVDAGEPAVGDGADPAGVAGEVDVADGVAGRHDEHRTVGRAGAHDLAGRPGARQRALVVDDGVHRVGRQLRGAVPAGGELLLAGLRTPRDGGGRDDPAARNPASGQVPSGLTTTSSTSSRASSRVTGRDSVGWPNRTTRSTSPRRPWPSSASSSRR